MDDDLFRREFDSPSAEKDNLFAWTIVILLLIGAALAVWLGSYYIFAHPESPKSYAFLQKLGKIDPPKRFLVTAAPQGEFLTAEKLYDKYALYSRLEIKRENDQLMRDYLRNYRETKKLVPYVVGRFNIIDSYELKDTDVFASGVVALAMPEDYPRVLLEHVYTSDRSVVPVLSRMLRPGLDIRLERSTDLSAIIHIERLEDGRLMFTAVPLLYGSYALRQAQGGFNLEPPPMLQLEAGMPVVKQQVVQDALKQYVSTQRAADRASAPSALAARTQKTDEKKEPDTQELVRVDATPTPAPPVAVATPSATPTPAIAQATPRATPTPITVARNTTPTPPPSAATPTPPLQPFLVSKTTPGLPGASGGSWPVYSPGRMPRGRLVDVNDTKEIADRGTVADERVYLQGDFVVTASGGSRAVLRSRRNASAARIMVEFPSGAFPPREGESLTRDDQRPFLIRDVRKGEDGEVTIYVREVTAAVP